MKIGLLLQNTFEVQRANGCYEDKLIVAGHVEGLPRVFSLVYAIGMTLLVV